MAASSSSKVTIIFLLLTACSLSFFSIQTQARQLFNKVSSIEDPSLPMKQTASTPKEEQEERDPSFYAQTESSYGLYGRDSDQLTSETPTTSTYKPYVTPVRYHADEPYNAIPSNNNNEKQQQNLEEARNTFYNNNINDHENSDRHVFGNDGKLQQQNNNNNFEEEAMFRERNNYYVNNNNEEQIADQRQGMSDTRFLENGKYYHDINTEIRNTKYPQTAHASHDDLIYNNNINGDRRSNYYGNLQGRRNANYNNIDQNNYQEFQQFNGQP